MTDLIHVCAEGVVNGDQLATNILDELLRSFYLRRNRKALGALEVLLGASVCVCVCVCLCVISS